MTEDDVRELVRQRLERHGDQSRLAIELGVSRGHLCNFLAGKKRPPAPLLAHFGLKRAVAYIEKSSCGQAEKGA